jgi:protein SCO1
MNRAAMTKIPLLAFVALFTTALAGCGGEAPTERPPLAGARIGGPFELVDKSGRTVRWSQFDGKYRVTYFGFTFCPDACPLDVQTLMRGLAQFEQQAPALAAQVQPIFISVDPARDTPDKVGEFAAAFSPRLIGLTGSEAKVAAAAKAFAVYYAKGKETPGGYLMDHSRNAVLSGRRGEPIALLPTDQGPDAVAAELAKWVK